MSRNLLILALLAVCGTGCSATRPLLSTVVVTPPGLSFRQLPREDSWHWTPVTVTYPSASLTPAPCTPAPVCPIELVTCVEEDERLAPRWPSEPFPSVTTVVPVPPVNVPAPAPPAIVYLDNATSPQSAQLPIPSVAPVPLGITPLVQTASTSTLPAPPVRVESPPPTESNWKPATSIAQASPAQTRTAMRCDQDETTLPVMPVESLSPPVLTQPNLSELLAEIRNQRQLIEALQRELTRERSADDAAIEELEAAVENLLDQTQTAPREMPTTLR